MYAGSGKAVAPRKRPESPVLFRIGTFLLQLTDTRLGIAALAVATGTVGALTEVCIHLVIANAALPAWAAVAIDAFGLGAVLATVTILEGRALRERRLRVLAEISKVGALNHQVRNALCAIRYAAHLSPAAEYMEIINDSVNRIDDTLRKLFPAIIGPPERLRKPPQRALEPGPKRKRI